MGNIERFSSPTPGGKITDAPSASNHYYLRHGPGRSQEWYRRSAHDGIIIVKVIISISIVSFVAVIPTADSSKGGIKYKPHVCLGNNMEDIRRNNPNNAFVREYLPVSGSLRLGLLLARIYYAILFITCLGMQMKSSPHQRITSRYKS